MLSPCQPEGVRFDIRRFRIDPPPSAKEKRQTTARRETATPRQRRREFCWQGSPGPRYTSIGDTSILHFVRWSSKRDAEPLVRLVRKAKGCERGDPVVVDVAPVERASIIESF
jgi:hypothetical protein